MILKLKNIIVDMNEVSYFYRIYDIPQFKTSIKLKNENYIRVEETIEEITKLLELMELK